MSDDMSSRMSARGGLEKSTWQWYLRTCAAQRKGALNIRSRTWFATVPARFLNRSRGVLGLVCHPAKGFLGNLCFMLLDSKNCDRLLAFKQVMLILMAALTAVMIYLLSQWLNFKLFREPNQPHHISEFCFALAHTQKVIMKLWQAQS